MKKKRKKKIYFYRKTNKINKNETKRLVVYLSLFHFIKRNKIKRETIKRGPLFINQRAEEVV